MCPGKRLSTGKGKQVDAKTFVLRAEDSDLIRMSVYPCVRVSSLTLLFARESNT